MDGKEELTMSLSPEDSLSEDGKNMEKCCSDCKTTKTPLWRGGPAGPKTLCNACGIRFRKRRSSEVRSGRGGADKKKETRVPATVTASSVTTVDNGEDGGLSASVKMGLVAWSKEVLLQHGRSPLSPASSSSSSWFSAPVKRQRSKRKLKEEEEAAVLLMSLSCGSVFA